MDVKFNEVIKNLPEDISNILNEVPEKVKEKAKEIRLRVGRNIIINYENESYYLNKKLDTEEIKECFKSICGYSIHSHTEEIRKGFITLKGGHRAGIGATAIYENKTIINLKYISSINLRIARQIYGAANNLINLLNKKIGKLLIVGPPSSGKTTILKDIAKSLNSKSVSIIDSRGEIAASLNGVPQNDVSYADVFDFWNRKDGITTAIRTMNPDFIICDEIGDESDIEAIKTCVGTGAELIATAHGENIEEIKKREIIKKILKTNAFSNIAILKGKQTPCEIESIFKVGELIWR